MKIAALVLASALLLASCCSHCHGSGNIKATYGTLPCPYCGGEGGWKIFPGADGRESAY